VNQRQKIVRGGLLLLTVVFISGLFSPLARAADANNADGAFNVVVSPPSVALEATPGSTVSTDLKIQNHGLSTEHVKVTVMRFGASGQDGTPSLLDLKPGDDFASWAHFSTTHFDAEPNVWKTVKMTISPPVGSAFGYYYAVIFSRDGADKQIQPKQANLLGAVASLVLLDVQSPGAVRKADITEFSTSHNINEFLPVDFVTRMHNTGNTHVATRGNIIISKGGKEVALLEVNLNKGYILPDSYRKFTNSWNDGTPVYITKTADGKVVLDAQGHPVQSLNWDKFSLSKLRIGEYTAKLVMVYDDGKGDVSTEATLSFWVIPWRIIGGFVLVGLLILSSLWITIGRPITRRLKKNRGYAKRR
jgi:hypothetical protein